MMTAKDLAQMALLVLRQLDKLDAYERQEVIHVAISLVAVEVARLTRPPQVRDE